jgi:hypothetical protein
MRACLWFCPPSPLGRWDDALTCDLGEQDSWLQALAGAARLRAAHSQPAARTGLARTPLLAAWAAHGTAPGQLLGVPADSSAQAAALARVPLAGLPGLPLALQRELRILRVFTLGDLAALPPTLLTAVFGPALLPFQALARGADPRWVSLAVADPRLGGHPALATVRRTLPTASRPPLTPAVLTEELAALTAGLAAALVITGRAATRLTLTLGYPASTPWTRPIRCAAPTATPAALQAAVRPVLDRGLRALRRQPAWLQLEVQHATDPVHQPALPLPTAVPDSAADLASAITTIHRRFGVHVLSQGLPPRHDLRPSPRP